MSWRRQTSIRELDSRIDLRFVELREKALLTPLGGEVQTGIDRVFMPNA